jgi:head-tail adaptor
MSDEKTKVIRLLARVRARHRRELREASYEAAKLDLRLAGMIVRLRAKVRETETRGAP